MYSFLWFLICKYIFKYINVRINLQATDKGCYFSNGTYIQRIQTENIAIPEKAKNQGENIPVFRYEWATRIYCDPKYLRRSMFIENGITVNYMKTLIVTSTHSYSSPGFIVKALSMVDKGVELRHSWTRAENSKLLWSGTVAIYKKWSNLKKAADHIVRYFENIQVVSLSDVVQLLVIAERNHKLFDVSVSKVIIKGRRSLKKEECLDFTKLLTAFGELKNIEFRKGTTEYGSIAVVEYRFVTHAFVAKFYIYGMKYSGIGFLHAEIVMTEKEKDVQTEVMRRFSEHVKSST